MDLDRQRLAIVTGKGGVGKSTVALALALAAARDGREVVLCEVGPSARAPELFGRPAGRPGTVVRLARGLASTCLDPRAALHEWLARNAGRPVAALLMRSDVFGLFVAAAPGARELTTIGKAWDMVRQVPNRLVVLDAPSTGHALALLRAPATFGAVDRVGPVGRQARAVRDSLRDPAQTAVVAVTTPTDLAVAETVELVRGLGAALGRGPDALVADMVLPARFTAAETRTVAAALEGVAAGPERAALRAAAALQRRAAVQAGHLRTLEQDVGSPDVQLPFLFRDRLALPDVEALSRLLAPVSQIGSPHGARAGTPADGALARRA